MKKLSTLLTLSTLAVVGVLLSAADCLGSDSAVETCEADTDCTTEGDVCSDGTCLPAQCNDDPDCDLQDTGEDSPIAAAPDGGCEADEVQYTGFDGTDYCATADEATGECAGLGFDTADVESGGDTVAVCVLSDGTCSEGQCS